MKGVVRVVGGRRGCGVTNVPKRPGEGEVSYKVVVDWVDSDTADEMDLGLSVGLALERLYKYPLRVFFWTSFWMDFLVVDVERFFFGGVGDVKTADDEE